jgi:hypothetical protein
MGKRPITESDLAQFIGTENYYRYLGINLTDGVKFLADEAGAYWLVDIVSIAQKFGNAVTAADSGPLRTVIPTDRGQRSGDCGQFLTSV